MKIQRKLFSTLIMVLATTLPACTDQQELQNLPASPEIAFNGAVHEIATRADDSEESEKTDPISFESGYGNIYIHAFAEGADAGFKTDGTYTVKEGGTAGILVATDTETGKLEWLNTTTEHYFHAWNVPEAAVTMDDKNMETGKVSFLPPTTGTEIDSYSKIHKKNNIALEKFIATQAGPVNYRTNGSYVKLQFQHLVSKVTVTGITRVKTDGGTDQLSDATITFPDMPQSGTFRTNINNTDHTTKPYIEITDKDKEKKGLSFNALSRINPDIAGDYSYYPFYLPPFHFKEAGEFIVEGRVWIGEKEGFETCRPYYGHLENIENLTELKAGEHMELRLRVKDGQVFGTVITIHGWTTAPPQSSGHSPKHKGIYSIDDLVRFYDYCNNQKNDLSLIEDLISIEKDEHGNEIKVIRLYNDIDIADSDFKDYYMGWIGYGKWPGDDFVFDGMGHNITSYNKDTPFFTGYEDKIRDLWLDGKPYGSS